MLRTHTDFAFKNVRLELEAMLKYPAVHFIDTISWHFPPDRNKVIPSSGKISASAEGGNCFILIS